MLITDICLDYELQETIFYEDPLLQHSMYIVEYDHYMRPLIPWHWHNELELIYIASGECIYRTSRREYRLVAGDAIYLNPGVLHALAPIKENAVTYANLFKRTFLTGATGSYYDIHYVEPVLRQKAIEAIPFYGTISENQQVLDQIRKTIVLCTDEPDYFALSLRNTLSDIWSILCTRMLEYNGDGGNQLMEANDIRVKQMLIYVMEHYPSDIKVNDLANAANVSERECYRLFEQQLRQTPNSFIRQYRVEKAKNLLRSTCMPVTEVATAVGFDSVSYFSKTFKQLTSLAPMEYRRISGGMAGLL